jgi:hypothetical protein
MSQGYLRRTDVGYPRHPNPRGIYAIKIFENLDLTLLQEEVNLYLLELPTITKSWSPHIAEAQYSNYLTPAPTTTMHVCMLGIYASGTITQPPIG